MLKRLVLAAFLLAPFYSAQAQAKVSAGVSFSTPEIFGGFLSIWPSEAFSFEFRPTLSTIDGGVSGHIPVGTGADRYVHTIVATFLAGWVHAGSGVYYGGTGTHLAGMVGYGYNAGWDIRLLGGISAYDYQDTWARTPTFAAMIGHSF